MSFIAKSSLMSKESTDPEQKKVEVMAVKERLRALKEHRQQIEGSDSVQAVPSITVENDTETMDKAEAASNGNGNDFEQAAAPTGAKPKLAKAFGSKLGKGGIARCKVCYVKAISYF